MSPRIGNVLVGPLKSRYSLNANTLEKPTFFAGLLSCVIFNSDNSAHNFSAVDWQLKDRKKMLSTTRQGELIWFQDRSYEHID